jgi:type II secretory pathway component GspD/PulD (secretin)
LKAVIDNTLIPAFNVASDAVGFTVNLITGNINLTAVIQSIQSFSDTAVLQRSTLCSLSGREIILDVSTKVPYVDTISSSTGSTGAAVRGYTFKEETSGTTLKITAVSDTDIVSILSDIKFQEITDYLNVGSGADTISRPIVSVRNLKSLLSVVPGSVVKLASFRFVRSEKDKSGLYYWPVTLKGSDVKIFELTVLARVSVKKYVFE